LPMILPDRQKMSWIKARTVPGTTKLLLQQQRGVSWTQVSSRFGCMLPSFTQAAIYTVLYVDQADKKQVKTGPEVLDEGIRVELTSALH
jgi:hypothetical protein